MGRGMQNPPPFGQMGNHPPELPHFDPGQWQGAMDQFRQDHPFPTNAGFPGAHPPVPMPPIPAPPAPSGGGGEVSGPGPGASGGGFPGFPHGSSGDTTGRVGEGWGRISGRNESGPGNALSRSFSATGSSGANRPPRGSNQ